MTFQKTGVESLLVAGLFFFPGMILFARNQEADTSYWSSGGMGSFSFSQVSLSNWAAGGENSVSGNTYVNLFLNYERGKSVWENNLDLGYGLIKRESQTAVKSDDKIDFSSKYGRKAFRNFFYSASFDFKTQFAEGYNLPNDSVKISGFMAPAYMMISMGMDYKPGSGFTIYLSPLSGKMTLVRDNYLSGIGAFGVEPGNRSRAEFGGYLKVGYKGDILKNVGLVSKLNLFSNYLENPEAIDVSWEVLVGMKINKYLSANISTHLIYDEDIKFEVDSNGDGIMDGMSPKVQFKEIFGIGFSFKF